MNYYQWKKMSITEKHRREIKYYMKTLNNFCTVIKDTNNAVTTLFRNEYNCMGYALGWYDWLDLDDFQCLDGDDDNYDLLEDMTLDCVKEIKRCYAARQISNPQAALPHERVFAFRCGFDDFHFARLNSDGIWTHKPGGNFIREMTEDELYGDAWCDNREYPYISTVYFFAIDEKLDVQQYVEGR